MHKIARLGALARASNRFTDTRFRSRGPAVFRALEFTRMINSPSKIDKTPRGIISAISKLSPSFAVRADDIHIILDPNDFYEQLKDRIKDAKRRVVLAALYLGNEPKPLCLVETIKETLEKNPRLEVVFVLDYLRGTRGISKDTPTKPNSSAGIVKALAAQFPGRVRGAFWHTPRVSGLIKKFVPERVVELVGVQHIKCFIVDDDVMLSGANLSEQYFTDRQDRYYWFKHSPQLSDFYARLLRLIETMSFSISDQSGAFHASTGLSLPAGVPDPSIDPNSYRQFFQRQMSEFWGHQLSQTEKRDLNPTNDTVVFPTCQVGPCDINNDHQVVDTALVAVPASQSLHITTPYCNFTDDFAQALLRQCEAKDVRVIVAHPTANGFFKGKGAHTLIPWAYSSFLDTFHSLVQREGHSDRITLMEYERPDWTFHAKGLWFDFPQTDAEKPATSVTIVGSSNFGHRSATRDLEAQALVVTHNANLVERLKKVGQILTCCGFIRNETLSSRQLQKFLNQPLKIVKSTRLGGSHRFSSSQLASCE